MKAAHLSHLTHSPLTHSLLASLALVGALAACNDNPVDVPSSTSLGEGASASGSGSDGNANGTSSPTAANNGGTSKNLAPLPNRAPVRAAQNITSARQVIGAGPFTGEQPTVRANDRHATPVTGKDCMTCHGTSGSAPHFSFGGTIALGKQWTWGTPTWPTGTPSGNNYDSYDGYGSYDASGGGGGGGGDGYGSYNNGGYDDGAYCGDDGGYGGGGGGYNDYGGGGGGGGGGGNYGNYGDDGYDTGGGGGSCGGGKKGWPADRSNPSPYTGVRLVGSDGYIFDTVTDTDGNFWFKATEDVKVPAYTGIRYGTFTVTGDTNGVACSSCHESGKADSPGRLWTWDGPTPRN